MERVMIVAQRYAVVPVVLATLFLGCVSHHRALPVRVTALPDVEIIMFHNRDRQLIQVYLVDATREWWLGRLQPLESARLPLPASFSTTEPRAIRLAVIRGSSRSVQASRDSRAIFSLTERAGNMAGQDWIFANGQLLGPDRNVTQLP
jgi:hypothetical protein